MIFFQLFLAISIVKSSFVLIDIITSFFITSILYQKNHFLNVKFKKLLSFVIFFQPSLTADTAITVSQSNSKIGKFALNHQSIKWFLSNSKVSKIIGKLILDLTASTIFHFFRTIFSPELMSVAIIIRGIFVSSIFIFQNNSSKNL
jgi:hypothetical protein